MFLPPASEGRDRLVPPYERVAAVIYNGDSAGSDPMPDGRIIDPVSLRILFRGEIKVPVHCVSS